MFFEYEALNDSGRSITGIIDAGNEQDANKTLQEKGLRVLFLQEKKVKKRSLKELNFTIGTRIKVKDLVVFFRQFAVMISANVSMVEALKIIVEQNTIEKQEHLMFGTLKELINRLEENQTEIVVKIKAESQVLARNTHLLMFTVIVGAFLVSIFLGLTIARSISKPVADLTQTTQAIAQGDFSVRVDIATADEIGELAASFNKMAEDLQNTTTSIHNLNQEITQRKKTEEALAKSERKFRTIFENAGGSLLSPIQKQAG